MSNSIIVVISTQFRENYGAHDWDGRGECPQHGGSLRVVTPTSSMRLRQTLLTLQWWNRC